MPTTIPAAVSVGEPACRPASSLGRVSLAMPKSRILTRPSLRDEQVVGLHVAVDDALVVRGGEPFGDLTRVVDRFARRQRARVQPAAERFPFEQLRDDVGRAGMRADVVDGQDVRVIELAGGARFLLEAMRPGWRSVANASGISLIATSRPSRGSRAR